MSFSGKYLRINLNTGEILPQQIDPADVRRAGLRWRAR